MNTWYTEWFNDLYLEIYKHRNPVEAQRHVDFVVDKSSISHESQILDVACGSGRHLAAYHKHQLRCVGIDRSLSLLSHASKELSFACADMRTLPFNDSAFDFLSSFFTSFGYFKTNEEHQSLLIEWSRVLKKHGQIFIDYLNPTYLLKQLQDKTIRQIKHYTVTETRGFTPDKTRVEKNIHVKDNESKTEQYFKESVRMYSYDEMQNMLEKAGFSPIASFGDFDASEYLESSPRMLLLAAKER